MSPQSSLSGLKTEAHMELKEKADQAVLGLVAYIGRTLPLLSTSDPKAVQAVTEALAVLSEVYATLLVLEARLPDAVRETP